MIYIIRHGQTDWNGEKRTQGSIETSLNEIGRKQAETVKQELQGKKINIVLCSPRKRCKETAEIICAGNDIIIQELEDLRERDYKNKNVLIITHSGVVAMIYCYLNNIKSNGKLNIPGIKNCEITKYNIN